MLQYLTVRHLRGLPECLSLQEFLPLDFTFLPDVAQSEDPFFGIFDGIDQIPNVAILHRDSGEHLLLGAVHDLCQTHQAETFPGGEQHRQEEPRHFGG